MGSPERRMLSVQKSLAEFVEDLYLATDFEDAFQIFHIEVNSLGFDGVLYTYVPMALVESNFTLQPFYKTSDNYRLCETNHKSDSSLLNRDALLNSANDDLAIPVDWWQKLCEAGKKVEGFSSETTEIGGIYGFQENLIIPLLSDSGGMAGASFIRSKKERLNQPTLQRPGLIEIAR